MGDIAKMTLDELAAYVVGLDGWEWMKGIVDVDGDVVLGRGRMAHLYLDGGGGYLSAGERYSAPDLTDPATLGCLLAMVRARYGQTSHVVPTGSGWRANLRHGIQTANYPTEAHALVAALAKEAS